MTTLGARIDSPPPRNVEPWTRVVGHQVILSNGPGTGLCRCGEGQSDERSAHDWRDEHLANAWPVLIEQLDNESLEQWRARVMEALEEARVAAEPEAARLMAAMHVRPGDCSSR